MAKIFNNFPEIDYSTCFRYFDCQLLISHREELQLSNPTMILFILASINIPVPQHEMRTGVTTFQLGLNPLLTRHMARIWFSSSELVKFFFLFCAVFCIPYLL